MLFVDLDIVEGRRIRAPHDLAGGREHLVGEIFAGREVADPDREELGTLGVGAPGEKPVVGGMVGVVEIEERGALRLGVAVEKDLGLARRCAARGRRAGAGRPRGSGSSRRRRRRPPARSQSSSLMRPRISATIRSRSGAAPASTACENAFSASRWARIRGGRTAGSLSTSIQLAALSQAKSSRSRTPWTSNSRGSAKTGGSDGGSCRRSLFIVGRPGLGTGSGADVGLWRGRTSRTSAGNPSLSQPVFAWFCRRVAGNRGENPNVREFSTCVLSPADLIETTIRASSPSSAPAPASTSLETKISL